LLTTEEQEQQIITTLKKREQRIIAIRRDSSKLEALKVYYRHNPIDFINDWGMTFDPRNKDVGLPSDIPFTLFPRQIEWLQFTLEKWRNREDFLTEKTREMGLSWL